MTNLHTQIRLLSPDRPLVSICIPAYNSEKYIGVTIDCLLKQTYKNIEIIVVDDGSEDNTLPILKNITDARFKYLSQSNKGASAARNAAYKISTGAFIKFMDADDLLNETCIENQLSKIIEKANCIASATWGRFYTEDLSDFKFSYEKVWKDLSGIDWLVDSLIDTGANMMQSGIFLIPKQIVEKAGLWDESLSLIDDFDYMVRVITNSNMVLFCDDAILMYRSGLQNSLSGKDSPSHMASALKSLQLGVAQILRTRNDPITRQACANTFKRWAYQFYPSHNKMYNKLEQAIDSLGGSNTPIIAGRSFTILSKIIGWKNAKKLKIFFRGEAS